jgi:hypothetical protein
MPGEKCSALAFAHSTAWARARHGVWQWRGYFQQSIVPFVQHYETS